MRVFNPGRGWGASGKGNNRGDQIWSPKIKFQLPPIHALPVRAFGGKLGTPDNIFSLSNQYIVSQIVSFAKTEENVRIRLRSVWTYLDLNNNAPLYFSKTNVPIQDRVTDICPETENSLTNSQFITCSVCKNSLPSSIDYWRDLGSDPDPTTRPQYTTNSDDCPDTLTCGQ